MTLQQLPLWTEWVRWAVEIVTPVAAIALFIATLSLVNKTRAVAEKTADLVKETIRGTDQLDRHHQEALLPMVYVDAELRLEHQVRNNQAGMLISLRGSLVNVGPGPATSVNLLVHPAPIVERSFYQGLIGPNSRQPLLEVEYWLYPITFDRNDGPHPFTVTTKYVTLFNTVGHTKQRSHSGRRDDLIVESSEKPMIAPRRLSHTVTSATDSLPPVSDAASLE